MHIVYHTARRQSGYGLLIVMAFMLALVIVFASLMRWSSSSAQITKRNNLFNQSENAAESATENILASMMRDYYSGPLGSAGSYSTNFPPTNGWPVIFQFCDTNGNAANAATVYLGTQSSATNLSGLYAGLSGFAVPCTIASTATPLGQGINLSATVAQYIQFAQIPLFQFAIFYNMDLEINPGAGMNIGGAVHCNNTIWATGNGTGGNLLVFSNSVQAASGVILHSSTNDPNNNRSGNVLFTITNNNPLGNANVLNLPIGAGGNNSQANVAAILAPPPTAYAPPNYGDAYYGNGTNYLNNEADLIVSNSVAGTNGTSGTNIMVYYQNRMNSPNYITPILPDLAVMTVTPAGTRTTNYIGSTPVYSTNSTPATNINYPCYSFMTNASFSDRRENKTVQAVQIDVAALNKWLTNTFYLGGTNLTRVASKTNIVVIVNGAKFNIALNGTNTISMRGTDITGLIFTNAITTNGIDLGGKQYGNLKTSGSTRISSQGINSIYTLSRVLLSSSTLPAVRVVNGQQLPPSGLTVATALPIYVKGNYNITTNNSINTSTGLGDTVNTCPAAFMGDSVTILSASWSDPTTSALPGSTTTTINAATLEGIVPSNGTYYSGGVENFLRLLENWSGNTLYYNGSIVVMFPSQYATNRWITTGTYYNAPTRRWGFDTKFNNINNMPPLTPHFQAVARAGWSTQ